VSQEATKMKTINVSLFSNTDVKDFVNIVSRYDFDIDLVSGRYVVDAKSIMGIFSLDLSKPIDLTIHAEDELDRIMGVIAPYIVE
jgi:phosphotransferase system HPr-like phosphotransfer protein